MGLDELLRAVRQLIRSREVLLAIGGSGRSEASLKHLTMDLGLEERVRFLGRLSDAELRDWYRAADLFVLPSKAYEGFGMVTAESLACGTPVVGTPIGATPELLEPLEPRLVATGTSAEALAAAIAGVIDARDPKLRSRCRAYASERFDWGKALPAWEEALVEAAESGLAADHGEAATRLGGPLTRRSS
jgi:glycosyltransferase involved in cell wall biosynthesis